MIAPAQTARVRKPRGIVLRIVLAVLAAGTALCPQPAWAWGRQGHRAAAKLAAQRLTPAAQQRVKELLHDHETLADASTWADEQRRDRRETAPWHYVNVPITEPRYDPRFCPPEGCVVVKIDEFRRVLADRSASREQKRDALRFLVHFVEDLHQPVHVGHNADRGGNDLQLQFFGKGTNLHALWDYGLIEHAGLEEDVLLEHIAQRATPENTREWSQGTTADWANESLALAKRAYRRPGSDELLRSGAKLGEDYERFALPEAERRLAQAGVRLAWILNEVLKEESQR